jgi:hypothetical protein
MCTMGNSLVALLPTAIVTKRVRSSGDFSVGLACKLRPEGG